MILLLFNDTSRLAPCLANRRATRWHWQFALRTTSSSRRTTGTADGARSGMSASRWAVARRIWRVCWRCRCTTMRMATCNWCPRRIAARVWWCPTNSSWPRRWYASSRRLRTSISWLYRRTIRPCRIPRSRRCVVSCPSPEPRSIGAKSYRTVLAKSWRRNKNRSSKRKPKTKMMSSRHATCSSCLAAAWSRLRRSRILRDPTVFHLQWQSEKSERENRRKNTHTHNHIHYIRSLNVGAYVITVFYLLTPQLYKNIHTIHIHLYIYMKNEETAYIFYLLYYDESAYVQTPPHTHLWWWWMISIKQDDCSVTIATTSRLYRLTEVFLLIIACMHFLYNVL